MKNKFRFIKAVGCLSIAIIILFSGCAVQYQTFLQNNQMVETAEGPMEKITEEIMEIEEWDIEKSPLNGLPIVDNKALYSLDKDDEVVHLYVTVLPLEKSESIWTMDDLLVYPADNLDPNAYVEVIVQEGDENGPKQGMFGYNDVYKNGIMRLRGASSRRARGRSFKIKLFDSAGLWRNQNTLNLNKHPYDSLRIKNKICYDIMEDIDNIVSLRTQFVHLHVKDLEKGDYYTDFGLFTHVEQPNKTFLRNHKLDENGTLYKAVFFEFQRYEEFLKDMNDPTYSQEAFEMIFEIRENPDHAKLIAMIEDVNNMQLDINEVMQKHFNEENYLTWFALNILLGNYDTVSQNFMLYSPKNSLTWYFIPWDYDGTFRRDEEIEKIIPVERYGIASYWCAILHKRYFSDVRNVEKLSNKIEELYPIVVEKVKYYQKLYEPIIKKYLFRLPDVSYLIVDANELLPELQSLYTFVEKYKRLYYENMERPMPIFLDDVKKEQDGSLVFTWEQSFDLQNDYVFYDFLISTDPYFDNIIFEKKDLVLNEIKVPALEKGEYYYRVIIRDEHGNTQLPFDYFYDINGRRIFGLKQFIVD